MDERNPQVEPLQPYYLRQPTLVTLQPIKVRTPLPIRCSHSTCDTPIESAAVNGEPQSTWYALQPYARRNPEDLSLQPNYGRDPSLQTLQP